MKRLPRPALRPFVEAVWGTDETRRSALPGITSRARRPHWRDASRVPPLRRLCACSTTRATVRAMSSAPRSSAARAPVSISATSRSRSARSAPSFVPGPPRRCSAWMPTNSPTGTRHSQISGVCASRRCAIAWRGRLHRRAPRCVRAPAGRASPGSARTPSCGGAGAAAADEDHECRRRGESERLQPSAVHRIVFPGGRADAESLLTVQRFERALRRVRPSGSDVVD